MLNKKYIIVIIAFMLLSLLSSCKKEQITMIVPAGSPQYAQLYMQHSDDYDVTIVEGADPLVAAFGSISYDVIVAPINLGAKLYDSKPDYQLISVITWGSYYLISTSDINEMDDAEIIAFGQNQVPDAILQYVLKGYEKANEITYLDSLSAVVSQFMLDDSKLYLVSEPSLSIIMAQQQYDETLQIVDIQNMYQELTGNENFPQAGVFVHHALSDRQVENIKTDYIDSINLLNEETQIAATLAKDLGINIEKDVFIQSIPRSNIKYRDSIDAKGDIIYFLGFLKGFNPNFIGENLPNDSFYR